MTPEEEQELLAPSPEFQQDQETEALRQRLSQLQAQQAAPQERYVNAPITQQAYRELPATAQPQPAPQQDGGFDWARALTVWGGGDVGALDALRARREGAPMRDLQYRNALGEMEDAQTQRRQAYALVDPNSVESKQQQASFRDYLQGLSNAPGLGSVLQNQLRDTAGKAAGMSASQIARIKPYYDQLFESTRKALGTQAQADLASENIDLKRMMAGAGQQQAQQKMGLEYAQLGETRRHNTTMEDLAANKATQIKSPPQQVVRDYNQKSVALKEIARIEQLLSSGKIRYTGYGANTLNHILSLAPGSLDVRTPEERELAGLVKRLRAPERKNIFGAALSKFDIKDSDQFMADIEQNPATMKQNLSTLKSALLDENTRTEDQFPSLVGEKSTLTKSQGSPEAFGGAGIQTSIKAPPGTKPGDKVRQKSTGKIFVVQQDGTMIPE